MVLKDGRRYTEWVNMTYEAGHAWTPLWDQMRAREYYLNASNSENVGEANTATSSQEDEMRQLSAQLHKGWESSFIL
eukprot:SAG31_NODE_470_length_15239_cov_19.376288_9_plen_77_part_00